MRSDDPAPYMKWAKFNARARYDLANSNLHPCAREDLPGVLDDLPLAGANPDGYPALVEAIGRRYGVESNRIALGMGCSGANFLACCAVLRPGDDALVEHPVYDPLPAAARMAGAAVRWFERQFEAGWEVDPDRVADAMGPRTRLIILSSPHNPTGVTIPPDTLLALGDLAARHDAWVLVDQVYRDAVYDDRPVLSADVHDRCITTSSLTKAYGLGGLRCGWAIAAPAMAAAIRRVRDVVDAVGPYAIEVASARAFGVLDRLERRARAIIEANLTSLKEFMRVRSDLQWVEPAGGTVAFPRLRHSDDADAFVERLARDHDTAVVPGRFFGAPAHFRVACGGETRAFDHGLAAVAAALQS